MFSTSENKKAKKNTFHIHHQKGFTLIELLVAISVFSLLILLLIGVSVNQIKNSRRSLAVQEVEENARFILESMIKEIRMSQINSSDGESQILNIDHPINGDVTYEFDEEAGAIKRQGKILNSTDLEISGFFSVQKLTNYQPRVTIVMRIKKKGVSGVEQKEIDIQNTVSSRFYE